MNITFQKANPNHKDDIFSWLEEPHVMEFWDNSQAHKNDIINFLEGRKTASSYADGKYSYWIASADEIPFAMFMTIKESEEEDIEQIKKDHLSKTGNTYTLEYMIGNKEFLGKGLGSRTLREFVEFFQKDVDSKADTFFIDPITSNERAKHVYEKAGFKIITEYILGGNSYFSGKKHYFMKLYV